MSENNHAAFDQDEQDILSKIVPDLGSVEEGSNALPDATAPVDSNATATAPAEAVAPVVPAAPAEAPATVAPATQEAPAAPQGDTRAALRASRRSEKRLRDDLEALRQENEALKQGKAPADTNISDEELAQLDADFPVQAKIVRKQRELDQKIAQTAVVNKTEPEFEPPSFEDHRVQEVIDGIPDLVAWQYDPNAQDKFARATQYDAALAVDPDWMGKNIAERFAEAARRTKVAFGITTTPTPAAAPAAPRTDPAVALAQAPVAGPKGISDFRGGAPATPTGLNYQGMSDEQIMASLPAG